MALDSLPAGHAARNHLQEVSFAAERASNLTRQMLAYAGKGSFVVEPLELSTLIQETERLVHSSVPKNIDLRLDLNVGLPCMEGDAGQMQQVIMNLVINAAEAIPAEQPGIVLVRTSVQTLNAPVPAIQSAEQQFVPGDYVVLEVHDTGTGMDEATLARIFEPFFTTKYIGRGLGLSAMLGIVHGHKGFLKVTSSPGKGSTFQVFFPALSESRPVTVGTSKKTSSPEPDSILVVDDESSVRNLTQAVLRRSGYTVLMAEDALSAIELLQSTPQAVSLVILDLSMPGMSALDAVDEIHRCWPDTRIMLSSGYGEQEVLESIPGKAACRLRSEAIYSRAVGGEGEIRAGTRGERRSQSNCSSPVGPGIGTYKLRRLAFVWRSPGPRRTPKWTYIADFCKSFSRWQLLHSGDCMLRTVHATRYVTPLREGGSLPALVEADDLGLYVLKFTGAGQGPLALVAEIIAGEIGRRLASECRSWSWSN